MASVYPILKCHDPGIQKERREIPLARYGLARLRDQLFGSGDEHAGVVDQLATPLDVDMTDRRRC